MRLFPSPKNRTMRGPGVLPFWLNRPGQVAGNSERARGIFSLFYNLIFILFFKYETIVSRYGWSLGYSERDTSSVTYGGNS